jgi:hypothetical protein
VRCSCGCRELVRDYDPRQRHHFVNRDHWRRWKQRHPDRIPALSGSKKAEIIDALRQKVAELGTREVERLARCPYNVIPRYANGRWTYLAPTTVEYLRRVIPEVMDAADPRLAELIDTHDVRVEMGKHVGAVTATTWAKRTPRQRAQAGRRHGDQLRGQPNPGVAGAQRAKWDTVTADPAQMEQALAILRTRTRRPSDRIPRAWQRYEGRILRAGRAVTADDLHRCAVRQASDLGLDVEIVERVINRARGVDVDPGGRAADIDLLCAVRDIRNGAPGTAWISIAAEVNRRLSRNMNAETVKRQFRQHKDALRPQIRKIPRRGEMPWTDADDAYLHEHRADTDIEIGRHLHRSPQGVKWRRSALGIRKRPAP